MHEKCHGFTFSISRYFTDRLGTHLTFSISSSTEKSPKLQIISLTLDLTDLGFPSETDLKSMEPQGEQECPL